MSLKELIAEIENHVGLVSKTFKTLDSHQHKGHVYKIPFHLKPAQQFLACLDASTDQSKALTDQLSAKDADFIGDKDASIKDFAARDVHVELKVTKGRINRLVKSAKIYVNTDIFPQGLYHKALSRGLVRENDKSLSDEARSYWQNLAVGVCHAQEIDLLVNFQLDPKKKKALVVTREGEINEKADPSILLLSSPVLNFTSNGLAHLLGSINIRSKYIDGMYRNIFTAAQKEGREYLVMDVTHGGKHGELFNSLIKVAKEFPKLNIIYNAGEYAKDFDAALTKAQHPTNIARTDRNTLAIAHYLVAQGKSCAVYNPSEANVIYGHCDVGDQWKKDNHHHFTYANFIGSMTTAPLNSYGFNPKAFTSNIVEHHLSSPEQTSSLQSSQTNVPPLSTSSSSSSLIRSGSGRLNLSSSGSYRTLSLSRSNSAKKSVTFSFSPREIAHSVKDMITSHSKTHEPSPTGSATPLKKDESTPNTPTEPIQPTGVKASEPVVSAAANVSQPTVSASATIAVAKEEPTALKTTSTPPSAPPVVSVSPAVVETKATPTVSATSTKDTVQPPASKPMPKTPSPRSPHRLFQPEENHASKVEPKKQEASNFTKTQLREINSVITNLQREINSFWPYPNKDLKQIKINALNHLKTLAMEQSIEEAIENTKKEYPRLIEGRFSTRTADLLSKLVGSQRQLSF